MDVCKPSKEDIVVTGMGCVSPLGNEVETLRQSLLEGVSGIKKITSFDTDGFPISIAGEVRDFYLNFNSSNKKLSRLDPFIQYGLEASLQAISQANLKSKNVATIIGTGQGGINMIERNHLSFLAGRYSRISPFLIPGSVAGMLPGYVSSEFKFKGPSYSVSSTCSTSAQAIVDACRLLKLGEVEAVVAGGAESAITPLSLLGFHRIKALSSNDNPLTACRPFDIDRDGFIASEGAGVVVLEKRESAERRKANILGVLVGYGVSSDAYHPTAPLPSANGQAIAMYDALVTSGLSPENVDYINAHGTSTPLNDICESKAINKVFGVLGLNPLVSSTKVATGHLLGAAGALELIISLLCLNNSLYPGNFNLKSTDPSCKNISLVPQQSLRKEMRVAMTNSFGFGGSNCSILLAK